MATNDGSGTPGDRFAELILARPPGPEAVYHLETDLGPDYTTYKLVKNHTVVATFYDEETARWAAALLTHAGLLIQSWSEL